MRKKSVKKNVVSLMLVFLFLLTGIFLIFMYQEKRSTEAERDYNLKEKYIVQLNEVQQLQKMDLKRSEEKINDMMNELRTEQQNHQSGIYQKLILVYVFCVGMLLILFFYLYFLILKPFDDLEQYADEIAAGNLERDFRYRRVNLFGHFTWAFDHMRTEIINARKNEQAAIENNKTVIATLSHDIKTPIASIRGYAEAFLLNMDATKERRERYANVILKKCDEVTKITNDMFLHALHDLNHLVIKQEEVEIDKIIENTITDVRMREKICVNGKIAHALLASADPERIEQVIGNIIGNAEKYAKGSAIEIKTKIYHINEGQECQCNLAISSEEVYELSIRDYGLGIADEDMPFVFEKFYRGKNAQQETGAGLGLYIVKYIMEKMQGDVKLVNHKDGLEVCLYFPIK